ncbi:hypothetical protein DBB_33900 [Desulfoluna spongiiphila]|nr:hypothetical protein DBB_33900 [Desulfoluna spongiiphila]
MFKSFQNFYCPYCNALLQPVNGVYPKTCVFCNKPIAYGKSGTAKSYIRLPDLPIKLQDIIAILGLVGALIYAYFLASSS